MNFPRERLLSESHNDDGFEVAAGGERRTELLTPEELKSLSEVPGKSFLKRVANAYAELLRRYNELAERCAKQSELLGRLAERTT